MKLGKIKFFVRENQYEKFVDLDSIREVSPYDKEGFSRLVMESGDSWDSYIVLGSPADIVCQILESLKAADFDGICRNVIGGKK